MIIHKIMHGERKNCPATWKEVKRKLAEDEAGSVSRLKAEERATTAFPAPTPSYEKAVGLEVFQHAEIRANPIAREKELKIGEDLELEMELVNAGKGPALLVKIEDVIPRGFELVEKSQAYRVEDGCLNMKGKRIDPLKTEELKLVLRTRARGTFPFKPRIVYSGENGTCKSHELEALTVTVRELGIKGWLKGER